MAIGGNTELLATKATLISNLVQMELAKRSLHRAYITDVSSFAQPGYKRIDFPKFDSFTAVDRASGVASVASVITAAVDSMDLDQSPTVSWLYDSHDLIQSSVAFQAEAMKRSAAAVARYVDQKIVDVAEAEGEATTTAGAAITRDILLEMREKFLKQFGDLSEASLWINPAQETNLLKIAQFSEAQVYGGAVIPSGNLATLYGINIVRSNFLTDAQYMLVGKSGIAIGFQKAPGMEEDPRPEFGTGAKLAVVDALFGCKALQIAQGGAAVGKSALVIKDNN